MKKKKKLKLKKKPMLILIGIILLPLLVFGGIKLIQNYQYLRSIEYRLIERGYSIEEVNILQEKLSNEVLLELVARRKNNDLVELVKEKYFIAENMARYLEFKEKNRTRSTTDIIAMVNVNADRVWYSSPKETNLTMDYRMLVNKFNFLPEDYKPNDIVGIPLQYAYQGHSIRQQVLDAFIKMWRVTNDLDLRMVIDFSFRSFEDQERRFETLVSNHGRSRADELGVRPGFSEQQSGLAIGIVRLNTPTAEFEQTEEFAWLQKNAYRYGFILRYPKGKEHITGFRYESSHFRYVGRDLAKRIHEAGITFDEYYAFYLAR